MEGSAEPVSLMMKGAGEGGLKRTRIRRKILFFSPHHVFFRRHESFAEFQRNLLFKITFNLE